MKKAIKSSIKMIAMTCSIAIAIGITPTARASGETWCTVADPNDTYVNKRYPQNGTVTGSLPNGTDIWVAPDSTKSDNRGRRWAAAFRNDKSGEQDCILAKFLYKCCTGVGRSCVPITID